MGDGPLDEQAIVVQTVDDERHIAIYSYATPRFSDPWREGGEVTASVLLLDTGVITDRYGWRLSA